MKTTSLPIEGLLPYAGNPRRNDHAVEQVAAAIKRFGFRVPVLAKSDGSLIDGHLRIKAARRLGMAEVPVVLCDDLSEAEIKALRISINRMAELAEWDEELLMSELEGLAAEGITMDDVGFDLDALEALGAEAEPEGNPEVDTEPQIDKAEELRAKWGVEPGQLWELGDHRLLCGDSTKKEDVERVMGGAKADMVFTDPPYNVNVAGGSHDPRDKKNYRSGNIIGNDKLSDADFGKFLSSAFESTAACMAEGASVYVCFSDSETKNFINAFSNVGFHYSQMVIWKKQQMVFGRKDYHSKHEPILYGWKLGAAHYFVNDRTQDTVWEIDRPMRSEKEHPTQKPVDLYVRGIGNSSKHGALVYEPFCGAGTSLIACEQLDRKCRAIEISPAYVAVAIQRWVDATGKTPCLVS